MQRHGISISIIFEPDNQYYLTGFKAICYTRPIVTVINMDSIELIVPALEEEHATAQADVDKIHVYYEQPEKAYLGISYLDHLNKILSRIPTGANIGAEYDILTTSQYKYLTSEGFNVVDVGNKIKVMRFYKDQDEIKLLEIAGKLSDIALKGSLESAYPGQSELEFDLYGDKALLEYVSQHYPNTEIGYENWTCSGIERTVMPHLYSNTRKLQKGDVIIHSRQVWVDGYRAENERTFFIGEPTLKQKEAFKLAVEAEKVGMEIIKPGIMAKEVDLAARQVFKKAGYEQYANHRIGHGLGLSEHEEPYLRFDSDLILEEGMVFTIEPGIYVPGIGGFRHSDTVILTKDGIKTITKYPRELEDLIF